MDNSGVIWLKSGADKRRVTSREEVQRIFQASNLIHGDEVQVRSGGYEKIDFEYFKKLHEKIYDENFILSDSEIPRILENMRLADNGFLNVAGALLVAKDPNFLLPAFVVKAICYPGNDIHVDTYIDNEDILGKIENLFKESVSFISRNIRRIQAGQNVNTVGKLEIPKIVLEELIAKEIVA